MATGDWRLATGNWQLAARNRKPDRQQQHNRNHNDSKTERRPRQLGPVNWNGTEQPRWLCFVVRIALSIDGLIAALAFQKQHNNNTTQRTEPNRTEPSKSRSFVRLFVRLFVSFWSAKEDTVRPRTHTHTQTAKINFSNSIITLPRTKLLLNQFQLNITYTVTV